VKFGDSVDCSDLTEDEREYLRCAAAVLGAIATSRGQAPRLSSRTIGEELGWDGERVRRVARDLRRIGVMVKRSAVVTAMEEYEQTVAARYRAPMEPT
jgi:hypothetical protein